MGVGNCDHIGLGPPRAPIHRQARPFRSLLGIAGEVAAPTFGALYSGEWRHHYM
jgi:hypothetical protein